MPETTLTDRTVEHQPAPAAILAAIGEVAYAWSTTDDTLAWGPNVADVLGVSAERIATGEAFRAFLDPAHRESRHRTVLDGGEADDGGRLYRIEYPFHPSGRKDGTRLWIEDVGRWYAGADGKAARAHGIVRVINERHERDERLAFLSRHDEVTGCLNRLHLVEVLRTCLARAVTGNEQIAFIVAAIDNFDTINEVYGFDAGDEVFAAVAQRMRSEVRSGDTIGRFSGGMLGLVLRNCNDEAMRSAALRFESSVRDGIVVTGPGSVAVTISSGGVLLPRHGRTAEEAMARAREALQLARNMGHGHFVPYTHSPGRQAQQRANAALSTELVAALRERRLSLAFQPVVDVETRALHFHEALVRINRPGEAAASDFAAFAERLGLIRLVDRHVLDLALDVLANTERHISINVSADTLSDTDWMGRLTDALAARPELAGRLVTEITETAMIKNLEEAATFVGHLHDAGVRVAIDDFGAGFSSFRNLRVLDVDIVKIDGSFIENLPRSPDDQVFVRILTELAKSFGITTIAEWVQDEETVEILRSFGVDAIQGRLTGFPTPG
ncbi:MAG: GGDEF and EAL domain-containing protein [Bauldia sp.]|nr:GGDEF and EAL domain-containing protein [Bauldia sp.]